MKEMSRVDPVTKLTPEDSKDGFGKASPWQTSTARENPSGYAPRELLAPDLLT